MMFKAKLKIRPSKYKGKIYFCEAAEMINYVYHEHNNRVKIEAVHLRDGSMVYYDTDPQALNIIVIENNLESGHWVEI